MRSWQVQTVRRLQIDSNERAVNDPLLFESFFGDGQLRLLRAMYLVTGNRDDARELTQEAYARVWERWDRVAAMDDPDGYLYRTAMNLWRSRSRRLMSAIRPHPVSGHARDAFADIEHRDEVVRALRRLSPRQRAALVLTEILDQPAAVAGQTMGITPSTVRALATQGRIALREWMESDDG